MGYPLTPELRMLYDEYESARRAFAKTCYLQDVGYLFFIGFPEWLKEDCGLALPEPDLSDPDIARRRVLYQQERDQAFARLKGAFPEAVSELERDYITFADWLWREMEQERLFPRNRPKTPRRAKKRRAS